MSEVPSLLVYSYPTPGELEVVRAEFESISVGTILAARESITDILSRSRVHRDRLQTVQPNISLVLSLAASAAQEATFGAFTRSLTTELTGLSYNSVKGHFGLMVERGLFGVDKTHTAAPKPRERGRDARRSELYQATELGQSILSMFLTP